MSWGNPRAFWWLLLAAPVTALFLYRRRAVIREIPGLLFWRQIDAQRRASHWGRLLNRWVTLVFQLAAIALLVSVLTDPSAPKSGEPMIIVLDDSATMQTIEPAGRSRFELARRIVDERIWAARGCDQVTIVGAAGPPRLLTKPGVSRIEAGAKLEELHPLDLPRQLDQAMELALSFRDLGDQGRVLVVTDAASMRHRDKDSFELVTLGSDVANVGIAKIEPMPAASAIQVVLTVHQMAGRQATLRLPADDEVLGNTTVTLTEGPVEVMIPTLPPPDRPFQIEVDPSDAFLLDNHAFGVLPAPRTIHVVLATDGNPYLSAVLIHPAIRMTRVHADAWEDIDAADLYILDTPRHLARPGATGHFIVFGGSDPFGATNTVAIRTDLVPTQWVPNHPLLHEIGVPWWRVRRSSSFGPSSLDQSVVEAGDMSLVFVATDAADSPNSVADFQCIYVNFDLGASDFVHHSSFPIFVWNAIEWLTGLTLEPPPACQPTGSPVRFPGITDSSAVIIGPDGEQHQPVWIDGDATLPFADKQGVYECRHASGTSFQAACYQPGELLKEPELDQPGRAQEPSSSSMWSRLMKGPVWKTILGLSLVFIGIEAFLFHRGRLPIR